MSRRRITLARKDIKELIGVLMEIEQNVIEAMKGISPEGPSGKVSPGCVDALLCIVVAAEKNLKPIHAALRATAKLK